MTMAVSNGEPRTLLNALKPMLGLSGDIKTPQEVVRIISLMRDAEKLMSRCIYINILTATIDVSKEDELSTETLEKFIATGGWGILNKWLSDAKKSDDYHIMLEVLKVLRDLPVSVDTLKQGTTGKIVKQLSKSDNDDIKKLSTGILRQWMNLVRNKSVAEKIKQNGAPANPLGANAQGANSVSSPSSESGKSGKRMRENQSSPQPEKKTKTLAEVKSGISQKPASKTKIIPPQPKPAAMESTGFMNALASAAAPVPARKRKRVIATAKTATTSTTSTSNSSTANNTKANYTGILDEIMNSQSQTHGLEEVNPDSANKAQPSPATSPHHTAAALGDSSDPGNDKDSDTDKENSQSSSAQGSEVLQLESSDAEADKTVKKSKKGKKVTWASDDKMNTYHFFEMDEEERALVRHPVNFIDAQHMEMKRERELVEQAKRLNEDRMTEKLKWYRPRRIERRMSVVDTGAKSGQKLIQSDRESSILADLFLTKSSLPDSAAEPDAEVEKIERGEPKVIPHDEKGTTHLPEKAHPLSVAGVQLPAALASLFSSGAAGSAVKPGPTQSAAQDAQLSVQNLLDKLMKPSSGPDPLTQLLTAQKQQQQQPLPQQGTTGSLPAALQQILQPLQHKVPGPGPRGPGGPGVSVGQGLLGAAPGDMTGTLNMRPPAMPFGPRGPGNRPEGPMRFPGPGGPRQGHSVGPHFPGPEGLGPRHRGPTPMRMQRPPGPGRGRAPGGPRPLLPELSRQQGENFEESAELGDQDEGEYLEPHMRGRGRGMLGGRGRGRARGRGMPLCRHFVSRRGCLRGNTCHFLHPGLNGPPL